MREFIGWACAVPLTVIVVAGVVMGVVDAIKAGEGVEVILATCLLLAGLAAGTAWGLGL